MREGTGWAAPESRELRAQPPDQDGIKNLSPAMGLELRTGFRRGLGPKKAHPVLPSFQVGTSSSGASSFCTAETLRQ